MFLHIHTRMRNSNGFDKKKQPPARSKSAPRDLTNVPKPKPITSAVDQNGETEEPHRRDNIVEQMSQTAQCTKNPYFLLFLFLLFIIVIVIIVIFSGGYYLTPSTTHHSSSSSSTGGG